MAPQPRHHPELHREVLDRKAETGFAEDDSSEAKEAEYRRAYLEQLKRIACPGCGEEEPVF